MSLDKQTESTFNGVTNLPADFLIKNHNEERDDKINLSVKPNQDGN